MLTRSYMIELIENDKRNNYYFIYPIAHFFNSVDSVDL